MAWLLVFLLPVVLLPVLLLPILLLPVLLPSLCLPPFQDSSLIIDWLKEKRLGKDVDASLSEKERAIGLTIQR